MSACLASVTRGFACGFQLMYITVHLPAFPALCGVPPSVSANALGAIGLGNAAGSLLLGYLGERYSQKRLLAVAYLLRTITIISFVAPPVGPQSALIFAATMGVLWLGVVPLVSAIIVRLFGLQHFNTPFGVAFLSHQVGAFIGSWLGGLSFDLTWKARAFAARSSLLRGTSSVLPSTADARCQVMSRITVTRSYQPKTSSTKQTADPCSFGQT